MRKLVATILLPLSIVPLVLVAYPRARSEHASFEARYENRDPLPAPHVRAPGRLPAIPPHPDRVPVLVYHGIGGAHDGWTASQQLFAEQMDALDRAGYQTISAAQYVRFIRGEPVRMPQRPLLLTFDDGRLDSFRGADAVLAQHHFRATMFTIAGETGEGSPHFLSAGELSDMAKSGRWDIEFHAGWGHRLIRAADGRSEPFYAALAPGEDAAKRMSRVTGDLIAGEKHLRDAVPGARTDLFAVPYSDYGQVEDRARGEELASWLSRRYAAWFVQADDPRFSRPGQASPIARLEPHPTTTAGALLRWLARHARHEEA